MTNTMYNITDICDGLDSSFRLRFPRGSTFGQTAHGKYGSNKEVIKQTPVLGKIWEINEMGMQEVSGGMWLMELKMDFLKSRFVRFVSPTLSTVSGIPGRGLFFCFVNTPIFKEACILLLWCGFDQKP